MATKKLRKWAELTIDITTWPQSYEFEKEFNKDIKSVLRTISEKDAEGVSDVITASLQNGNMYVLRLCEALLGKRNLLEWKKHKRMIGRWLDTMKETGSIPESERNPTFSDGTHAGILQLIVKILKEHKMMSYFEEKLFSILVAALDRHDSGLQITALHINNTIVWDQKQSWAEQFMDKTYEVLQNDPEVSRTSNLGILIRELWQRNFQALMEKPKKAPVYVDKVRKVLLFCKDQDWIDAENMQEKSTCYELVTIIIEDYINWHRQTPAIIKPMLPILRELWTSEDERVQSSVNTAITFVATTTPDLLDDDITDILLDKYFCGKDTVLVGNYKSNEIRRRIPTFLYDLAYLPLETSFNQMYKRTPGKFDARIKQFVEAMHGQDWVYTATLQLFWEMAKTSPNVFDQDTITAIVKTLPKQGTAGLGLMSLSVLSETMPEEILPHETSIVQSMKKTPNMIQMGATILINLSKLSEENARKYLKVLKGYVEKLEPAIANVILYNMSLISKDYVEAIAEYKKFFEKLKGNSALKEQAQHLLDIISGRNLEGVSKDVQQQQTDVQKIDRKTKKTEKKVATVGKEVSKTRSSINTVKKDVGKQDKMLSKIEKTVDTTVERVNEIDKKTLSHAPIWSKDVAKLMNTKSEQDWRLLASKLGYKSDEVANCATKTDPCGSLFDDWFTKNKTKEASFSVLNTLEEMNRIDAALIVENALKQAENVVIDENLDYKVPPPVFISYQWGIQNEVKLLKKHLEMAGFKCWMDIGQMGGGDKLFEKIDKGIRKSYVMISCVSEKYAISPNCNREVNLAVSIKKPIIPILMEKMSWPPPGGIGVIFGEYLFIRLFARPGEAAAKDERYWPTDKFQELLMQLRYNVAPDYASVTSKLYKDWWKPPDQITISSTKQTKTSAQPVQKRLTAVQKNVATKSSPEIFISYQWDKQSQIKILYQKLTESGYSCWLDIMQMGGGDTLYDKIDKGIQNCTIIISCVTSKYALSVNCRREFSLAKATKKAMVPLLMEDMAWPPEGPMSSVLSELKFIDCTKPNIEIQTHWNCAQMDEIKAKIKDLLSDVKLSYKTSIETQKAAGTSSRDKSSAKSSINMRVSTASNPVNKKVKATPTSKVSQEMSEPKTIKRKDTSDTTGARIVKPVNTSSMVKKN